MIGDFFWGEFKQTKKYYPFTNLNDFVPTEVE